MECTVSRHFPIPWMQDFPPKSRKQQPAHTQCLLFLFFEYDKRRRKPKPKVDARESQKLDGLLDTFFIVVAPKFNVSYEKSFHVRNLPPMPFHVQPTQPSRFLASRSHQQIHRTFLPNQRSNKSFLQGEQRWEGGYYCLNCRSENLPTNALTMEWNFFQCRSHDPSCAGFFVTWRRFSSCNRQWREQETLVV